jgi:hypothetical protein
MQTIPSPPAKTGKVTPEDRPSVNVLTLYEDELARDRAARAETHLIGRLGRSINVQFTWFSLNLLFYPEVMQRASQALRESDIVLFSISQGGDLPLAVKAWIAAILARHNLHECSLLALVELETVADGSWPPSPACLFLNAVARSEGLDFISQPPALMPARRLAKQFGEEDCHARMTRARKTVCGGPKIKSRMLLQLESRSILKRT